MQGYYSKKVSSDVIKFDKAKILWTTCDHKQLTQAAPSAIIRQQTTVKGSRLQVQYKISILVLLMADYDTEL